MFQFSVLYVLCDVKNNAFFFRKSPLPTPSPDDDSDKDPDYTPDANKEIRKVQTYFTTKDFQLRPSNTLFNKLSSSFKEGDVFPTLGTWEFGSGRAHCVDLSNVKKLLLKNPESILVDNNMSYKHNERANSALEIVSTEESDGANFKLTMVTDPVLNMSHDEETLRNSTINVEVERVVIANKKSKSKEKPHIIKKLLPSCKATCRQKCFERINDEQRNIVFNYYSKLNFGEKRFFLGKFLEKNAVKYYRSDAVSHKSFTVKYTLPLSCQIEQMETDVLAKSIASKQIQVCKTMFLHTIGHTCDAIITEFLNNPDESFPEIKDKRGSARANIAKKVCLENYAQIKNHIDSFHPTQSHYNLAHAPNRRYLPSDLSIYKLWEEFKSKIKPISYETYRKVFEKENIGFSKPSQDECPTCLLHNNHMRKENDSQSEQTINTNSDHPESCEVCDQYQIHKKKYTAARKSYEGDVCKIWDNTTELFAVDMQKVLIIPKMTTKNSFFVSRLVCFNETFANLRKNGTNFCIMWHEAIKGRTGPDVVSTFYNLLKNLADNTKNVIFWADNCAAQNKNWTLFTSCVIFVNENWGPDTITFKYFESGHSFMKADAIHGAIGKKWNKAKEVLDFEDLLNLIKTSCRYNKIIELHAEDFASFENGCQARKQGTNTIPLLEKNICSKKF